MATFSSSLNALMDDVEPEQPQKAAKSKKDRPVITLENSDAELFNEFAGLDAVMSKIKTPHEEKKSRIKEVVRSKFLDLCLMADSQLENPNVLTNLGQCQFQLKHDSRLRRLEGADGKVKSVEEELRNLGFDDSVVKIVNEKVIQEKQMVSVKSLTEMQSDSATAAEKAVAEKIAKLLQENLTKDEKKLALVRSSEVSVDSCWIEKAIELANKVGAGNTERAKQALEKLFSVIPPGMAVRGTSFTGDFNKVMESVSQKSTTFVKKTIKSNDGKYEAVCEGNDVTLYSVGATGNVKLGTKNCTSAKHAEMTATKWFRDNLYLTEALVSFSAKK